MQKTIRHCSKSIHSSVRLMHPRVFGGQLPRTKRMAHSDRENENPSIKAHIQSLYPSSWETVFQQSPGPVCAEDKVQNARNDTPVNVSMNCIRTFLEAESDSPLTCLGDDTNGLVIMEINSCRGRLSIADGLIRRVYFISWYM